MSIWVGPDFGRTYGRGIIIVEQSVNGVSIASVIRLRNRGNNLY